MCVYECVSKRETKEGRYFVCVCVCRSACWCVRVYDEGREGKRGISSERERVCECESRRETIAGRDIVCVCV